MYAIIEDSGTQIKVRQGDLVDLNQRELTADASTLTLDRVLVIGDTGNGEAKVGLPYLTGARVTASVVGEGRGPKVVSLKYKRRKGSRKKIGHRQGYLRVKIESIDA